MTMNNTPVSLYSRMAWTMGCYQDLKYSIIRYNIFKSFYVESNIYKVVVGIQTLANTILISEHLVTQCAHLGSPFWSRRCTR